MMISAERKKCICFRYWSRKGYSVLVSLKKTIKIGVLCLAYSLVNRFETPAQTDTSSLSLPSHAIEEVEITGRRSRVVSSDISRVVSVISHDEIERSGTHSFSDLLEFVSNMDIRQRGVLGVQADASIRGSSYDHVMILVNGINFSDPQTGHLALDLPMDPESIEKIEVLEGSAARSLGPGAFMGAINIITRKGSSPHIGIVQSFGDFGFIRSHIDAGFQTRNVQHFISAGRSSSSGYMHNTDHLLYNVYYRGTAQNDNTYLDWQGGYQDKKFGAGGFYSPRFPDQYEETGTWFGSLKVITGNRLKVTPHIYWRRKNDHFMLGRNNTGLPENYHLTDVYGSQLNVTHSSEILTNNVGFDVRSENILSNNIGFDIPHPRKVGGTDSSYYTKQYQRTNFSVFTEHILSHGPWDITAGIMINWNTAFDGNPALFPGIDASYKVSRFILFAGINRALHLPTFTDLFYSDPVNQGNLDLAPNRMFSTEAGIKYKGPVIKYNIAGFYNSGQDIIDWLWSFEANRFSPVNLEKYVSRGISAGLSADFSSNPAIARWLGNVSLHYMYLSTDKSTADSVAKYNSLRHKLSAAITQQLADNLALTWRISYQDRYGEAIGYELPAGGFFAVPYEPYWLIDGIIKYRFRYLEIFAEVSNILNTRYIDAGSARQPGRWFKAGVSLTLNFKKRALIELMQ